VLIVPAHAGVEAEFVWAAFVCPSPAVF